MRIIFFLSFFFLLINVMYKGPVLLTFSHSSIVRRSFTGSSFKGIAAIDAAQHAML